MKNQASITFWAVFIAFMAHSSTTKAADCTWCNFDLSTCNIPDDLGWTLVRAIGPTHLVWYPNADHVQGTDVAADNGADIYNIGTFSDVVAGFNQYLFITGDCSTWLIASKDAVNGGFYGDPNPEYRTICASSESTEPYQALWYNRQFDGADPWISTIDHSDAIGQGKIVYGESDFGNDHAANVIQPKNGAHVYIRNEGTLDSHGCSPTQSPTKAPSQVPSTAPSVSPSNNPTTSPSNDCTWCNFDLSTCNIPDDLGWTLVRAIGPSHSVWYPNTDHVQGTDVAADNGADIYNIGTFIDVVGGFNQYLFITGDCSTWLIASKDAVNGGFYGDPNPENRTICASSESTEPYHALWYNRQWGDADPWISTIDHSDAIAQGKIVYGESDFADVHASNVIPVKNGAHVYIRNEGTPDSHGCSPTQSPTKAPSLLPSTAPSVSPSSPPSNNPTTSPSNDPTKVPTVSPSNNPSDNPTVTPFNDPTAVPSNIPTTSPSNNPTKVPTVSPSNNPSDNPTVSPFNDPTTGPSNIPTTSPSNNPTTVSPSNNPSYNPTVSPFNDPTAGPSSPPSKIPTISPSNIPTTSPSNNPTKMPTVSPSNNPSGNPTTTPSNDPTAGPTIQPTQNPSGAGQTPDPTQFPTITPSNNPTITPSDNPTINPSNNPTINPSNGPTVSPSGNPTTTPSNDPTAGPTIGPTKNPLGTGQTTDPTQFPTITPSDNPTTTPSNDPTMSPSNNPTVTPSKDPTAGPTARPTRNPLRTGQTAEPTQSPTRGPTTVPTASPIRSPTASPTLFPTRPGETRSPSLSPTALPSTSPTVWRECIDKEIEVSGIGSIQILITSSAASKEIEIKLAAPKSVWFGVGFGGNTMIDAGLVLTVSMVNGMMRLSPRRLDDHAQGVKLSNALDSIDTTEVGDIRAVTLVKPWAMDGLFDFSDFLSGEQCELDIIWAVGTDKNFAGHGANARGSATLRSCVCPTSDPTSAPTKMPNAEPTGSPITTTDDSTGINENGAHYLQLSFGTMLLAACCALFSF